MDWGLRSRGRSEELLMKIVVSIVLMVCRSSPAMIYAMRSALLASLLAAALLVAPAPATARSLATTVGGAAAGAHFLPVQPPSQMGRLR